MRIKIEKFMEEQNLALRESKSVGAPVQLHNSRKLLDEIKELKF